MLKKLLGLLPNSKAPETSHQVIPRDQHCISRKDISRAALKTLYGLQEAGYEAYLVGGGVRDLLLGGHPKDFDVATNATPEQIKELFRRSRVIGRRFKIVHVRFGPEVIEVTTFRDNHHQQPEDSTTSARSEHGMLLRDNVYGDIRSDAIRRDFTINALYYTLEQFSVHDFTGGVQDLDQRLIRIIGNPLVRYQEDPVRMLRAVRFAAKLQFEIDPASAAPIHEHSDLLANVPPARLFEEFLKLFMSGYAEDVFPLLRKYHLLRQLLPGCQSALESEHGLQAERLIQVALQSTDRRIAEEKPVTPAFVLAALFWIPVQVAERRMRDEGLPPREAHQQAAQQVLSEQIQVTAIARRFTQTAREIWELQDRLQRRTGKRAERTHQHPRFRAAYDFLLMREQSGEDLQGLGNWWTQYQQDSESRPRSVKAAEGNRKRPRRRRPGQ